MIAFATLDQISAATPDWRVLFAGLTIALEGERVGLVGRNGSSKSTLLRMIDGDIAPAAGALAQIADASLSIAEALGVADGLARRGVGGEP